MKLIPAAESHPSSPGSTLVLGLHLSGPALSSAAVPGSLNHVPLLKAAVTLILNHDSSVSGQTSFGGCVDTLHNLSVLT